MSNNSVPQQIHLKSLNQYKKFQTGDYCQQFIINKNNENKSFISNSYIPNKCMQTNIVEFDLVQGAKPCYPQQTQMLGYDAQGEITISRLNIV